MNVNTLFKKSNLKRLTNDVRKSSDYISISQELNDNIFLHKDESFGVTYKVSLLEHEPLTRDELIHKVAKLTELFNFEDNIVCDVIYSQTAIEFDNEMINSYLSTSENKAAAEIIKGRLTRLNNNNIKKWQRNLYVSFRYFQKKKTSNFNMKKEIKSLFKSKSEVYFKHIDSYVNEITKFSRFLDKTESINDLKLKRLSKNEIVNLYSNIQDPYKSKKTTIDNLESELSDLVCDKSLNLDFSEANLGKNNIKAFSLRQPTESFVGAMSHLLELDFPFCTSLKITKVPESEVTFKIATKEIFLNKAFSDKAINMMQDLRHSQQRIDNGDDIRRITYNILVFGDNKKELENNSLKMISLFRDRMSKSLIEETHIFPLIYFTCLPQNYEPTMESLIKRSFTVHRSDLRFYVPYYTSFSGFKNIQQIYLSRENKPIYFDLFSNSKSHHSVVLADTGAGKSFFMNSIRHGLMAQKIQPLIFILEKKTSNAMSSRFFDGELNRFSTSDNHLNPFRGFYNMDKINFLTTYLKSAIKMTSETLEIDGVLTDILRKALISSFNRSVEELGLDYIEGEIRQVKTDLKVTISISLLIDELSVQQQDIIDDDELYQQINKLKSSLLIFDTDGTYGSLFSNVSDQQEYNSLFYVYDIDGLDTDPIKRDLIVLAIFEEIRQVKKLEKNKNRDVYFEIDEIAQFDNIPYAVELIIQFSEMGRKEGIWLLAATNRASNYTTKNVCKAMWSLADNYFFLPMGPQNAEELRKTTNEFLTTVDSDIISSLEMKPGEYSEIYYLNKDRSKRGAFRYHPTQGEIWLTPSNIKATRIVDEMFNKNIKPKDIIIKLSEEYPNGVL